MKTGLRSQDPSVGLRLDQRPATRSIARDGVRDGLHFRMKRECGAASKGANSATAPATVSGERPRETHWPDMVGKARASRDPRVRRPAIVTSTLTGRGAPAGGPKWYDGDSRKVSCVPFPPRGRAEGAGTMEHSNDSPAGRAKPSRAIPGSFPSCIAGRWAVTRPEPAAARPAQGRAG